MHFEFLTCYSYIKNVDVLKSNKFLIDIIIYIFDSDFFW